MTEQPPSPKYTTAQARNDIAALVDKWRVDNPTQTKEWTRLELAGRIVQIPPGVPDKQWRDLAGDTLVAVLDQAEAIE